MIMTYEWIFRAAKDPELRERIKAALLYDRDSELTYDNTHRIRFLAVEKVVIVEPYSVTSDFHHKIIPVKMTYHAVSSMMGGDFEHITADEIQML